MQVRPRPKALVGSSSSLARLGFAGSNSSLSRPGHLGGRGMESSISPVSPLSETTSVISDSDRPLFNLDERYTDTDIPIINRKSTLKISINTFKLEIQFFRRLHWFEYMYII